MPCIHAGPWVGVLPCPMLRAIDFDDESTWPTPLLQILGSRLDNLRAYEQERTRIDRLCEEDVDARWNPPSNRHKACRDETLIQIEGLIQDNLMIGYHWTRLCEDEIQSILVSGLKTLDNTLVTERISRRVLKGELEREFADFLLRHNESEDDGRHGHRTGMIWFIFDKATLTEEHGLRNLLGCWGGEGIYSPHLCDPQVIELLRAIGTACIVEAAIAVSSIHTWSVSQKILSAFLDGRGIGSELPPEMEGYVTVPVPANHISRVIVRQEPEFGRLTNCDTWDCLPT